MKEGNVFSYENLIKLLLLLVLICINTKPLVAQNDRTFSYELNEEEGLPSAQVIDGLQCSRGFIWIVSKNEGLVRFDGNLLKTYSSENAGISNNIKLITEAPDSMIWVISYLLGEKRKNIHVFDPIAEKALSLSDFFQQTIPFKEENIDLIQRNGDGTIWVKTFDSKIYEYNGDSLYLWTDFAPQDYLEVKKINEQLFAGLYLKGNILNNIAFIERSGKVLKTHDFSPIDELFFIQSSDKNASGESVQLLECIERTSNQHYLYKISLNTPPQKVDSFPAIDLRIFSGQDQYYYKRTPEVTIRYRLNSTTKDSIYIEIDEELIFTDREGGLWTSAGRGMIRRSYNSKSQVTQHIYALKNTIWHTAVRGISAGLDGGMFFAQGGVLVHRSKNEKLSYLSSPLKEEGLPDFFGMLLQRDQKALWLCDLNKVWNIDPQTLKYRYYLQNKSPDLFWKPYEDQAGRILLGSSQGLYYIDEATQQILPIRQSLLNKASIFAFYENKEGLWLCSSNGLFLLDKEYQLKAHYHSKTTSSNFIPHDVIVHLHEDADGWFWLASKGGGLIHWNPETGKYEQYTTQNQLIDNTLYAVYADDAGQLWLPSNNGLMCFNKSSKETIYYLEEQGLTNLEFNTISHLKRKDGKLFFGGINGAISFEPQKLSATQKAPSLVLTSFEKTNREDVIYSSNINPILTTQTISIRPNDKFFELSFSLLDYTNAEHHRYAYKIEGYDKNWQYIKSPKIKVNALPYGNYKLRIKAQTASSPWQEYDFPISIKVLRPFYLQWWFILSVLLLIIGSVVLIVRWRFTQLRKRKEELEILVTERTAEIAQQAEELKSLDRLKSRFFANISHELRTPLTLVLGYTEEMESKPYGMLREDLVRKKLEIIKNNGKSLLNLIEEILELSKLEAEKTELDVSAIKLKPFIGRVFSGFETFAVANNIQYRLDYNLPKDWIVYLDVPKIERIVNNLIANAFKFTPPQKEIVLQLYSDEQWIYILVEDTGMGIHKKDIPHIFERFYQAQYGRSSAQGGTGIGLALSKEFVELMGGSMEVQSEQGKGSTFIVKIPKELAEEATVEEVFVESKVSQEIAEEEDWAGPPKEHTLLLVEDNPDMQRFIVDLLQANYTIIRANNGVEGLKALQNQHKEIDLIISDAMMPLMDGFTMINKIKEEKVLRSMPVIMLTARAAEEDKLQALTIGVDDYLIKPFSPQELQIRIQNLLQNYKNRKLWKQELLIAAEQVHSQQHSSKEKPSSKEEAVDENEENNELEISQQDLLWMKEVEEEFSQHIHDEDFKIEILAKKMLLSKRQFERKIKSITGLTPAKLVQEVRMQKARTLLEKGSYQNVSEVSFAVGFKTPSYFSKLYAKRFGKKPTDYF